MLTKQVTCPVLVGRKNELQALIEMLERAVSGRGDTVLIAGDAGIGKSRLCRELKREATARGIRVIQGHCSMAESAVPYGPFMDALRFRLERGDGMAVAQLLGPLLRYLAPLFPELPTGGATAGELSEGPAERAFEAIGQVLQRLAELGPLLLLLEDFHWADPTSRDLLYFLSRRVGELPLLIVLTCRSDELHLGHPVRRLSAMLTRERLAREITLAPLTEPEVGEMVAAILETVPDPELVAAAATRTEGNPFFVEELIKGLSEAGAPGASGAMEVVRAGLPATISEVIVGRVEPLGSRAREVLSVAAVIGRTFSFDLLREVSGVEEEELLEVVEQLVTAQLLVEEHGPSGERYAFRHGLIHEVFYNDIIAPRRRFWHRRVAAALEAQASGSLLVPYEPLAYHSRLGGDAARAGEYALLAGDQAARLFAWRDAEARYQEALAALEPGEESAAREAAILDRLSYVAWCQSRMDDSQRHAEQALELRRGLRDHRGAAALLRRLAFLYAHQRGEWERAATCLREAIGLVAGEADGTEETLATVDLGRLCLERGLYDEAEAALERGLALASRYDGSGEEALALASLGLLAVHRGAVRAGVVRLDLALTLMVDRPLPLDRASGVFRAGIRALEAAREHERALAWIDAAMLHAAQHGAHADSAIYRAHRAAIERRTGQWEQAVVLACHAVDELREARRAELGDALRILGDLHRVRGDLAGARRAYDEARVHGCQDADVGSALVLLAEGQAASAAEKLREALAAHASDDRLFALRVLPFLVEAEVRAGQLERAAEAVEQLQREVACSDFVFGRATVQHAVGLVHAARGETDAARQAFESARAEWEALSQPYERARVSLDLANLLFSGDESRLATELAREALATFEGLGAIDQAELARRMLRRAGVRARAPKSTVPPVGPHGLTPREISVLAELAKGSTNKQIARALGITDKTVSIHVSNILAKLGCTTRTQAAGLAIAERLVPNG